MRSPRKESGTACKRASAQEKELTMADRSDEPTYVRKIEIEGRTVHLATPTPMSTLARQWYEAKETHKAHPTPSNAKVVAEAQSKLWNSAQQLGPDAQFLVRILIKHV